MLFLRPRIILGYGRVISTRIHRFFHHNDINQIQYNIFHYLSLIRIFISKIRRKISPAVTHAIWVMLDKKNIQNIAEITNGFSKKGGKLHTCTYPYTQSLAIFHFFMHQHCKIVKPFNTSIQGCASRFFYHGDDNE